MKEDERIFYDIDTSVKSQFKLSNGALVEVKGKNFIIVDTKKGMRFIQNILLVTCLKHNPFSMG